MPKSLQINEGMRQMAHHNYGKLWAFYEDHGQKALTGERKTLRETIWAGAALTLLQGSTPDGEWITTYRAHTEIPLRSAQRWMKNVRNLLTACGIPVEERAFVALVSETQDDPYSLNLIKTVNSFIDGKSATQIELALCAPKKKTPALPPADQQAERDEQRLRAAEIYVGRVEDLLAAAPSHGEVFDETLLNRFTAALTTALHKVNPGAVR
jgi:hypothetical protein